MKKTIWMIFFAVLLAQISTYAQTDADLKNDVIRLRRGRKYIKAYQKNNPHGHPSSFLIKADGSTNDILSYLSRNVTSSCYLHVYFGKDINSGINNLIITGVLWDGAKFINDISSPIWKTSLAEPNCGLVFDNSIDYVDNNSDGSIDSCNSGVIDFNTAKEYIMNFQKNSGNTTGNTATSESFLMNVDDLRSYMRNPPSIGDNAIYIQFYIGRNRHLGSNDKICIIPVGVAKTGVHIWSGSSHSIGKYVFDESFPCPKCNITNDARIDYNYQGQ